MTLSPRFSTSPSDAPDLPAIRLVPPPRRARRVAGGLAFATTILLVIVAISPWQQNVPGSGKVIAYAPLDRQQIVEAPVDGRVSEWFVQEGDRVEEGDPIVEIVDNDPQLVERMQVEYDAIVEQLRLYEQRAETLRQRVESVRSGREVDITGAQASIRAAEQSIREYQQRVAAYEAELETSLLNLDRVESLHDQGLASRRELELAQLSEARARTARDGGIAALDAARSNLEVRQASLDSADVDGTASIESAEASYQSALYDIEATRRSLAQMEVSMARQSAQLVTAPRAGTIYRFIANQGGEQVKAGDDLVVLVPDMTQRAVELWVDGNDAALVTPGREVRLQFEGWPAVQFAGWPSVAVGTFAGEVAFVDATDDGQGNFRVVVVPVEDEEPWPDARYLRQGVRTNGWILLNEVPLWFEFWRQFNGFPPTTEDYSSDYGPSNLGPISIGGKK